MAFLDVNSEPYSETCQKRSIMDSWKLILLHFPRFKLTLLIPIRHEKKKLIKVLFAHFFALPEKILWGTVKKCENKNSS